MILQETYALSNGVQIPKLGLGTWLCAPEEAENAVKEAIGVGYRLIDTAQAYENEGAVGAGVMTSGVPRDEIFVTTKVRAEYKTYASVLASIDGSLANLGFDYVDLLLIHAPQPWAEFRGQKRYFEENREVWRAFEKAYEDGKAHAIGVSNFLQDDIESLLLTCRIKPMVNQILCHVVNTPQPTIDFCQRQGILVESYSPIGHGAILDNPELKAMADKYGVSVAQLCIRYVLQLETVALPKAAKLEHIKANAEVDFVISDEDMAALKAIEPILDYGADNDKFPVFSKGI